MRSIWQDIADLVLPADCAGCGARGSLVCDSCRVLLYGTPARSVRPSPAPPGLPPVRAGAPYQDAVRALLLAHKERGALGLAVPLGRALAGAAGPAEAAVRDGARGRWGGWGGGGGAPSGTSAGPQQHSPRNAPHHHPRHAHPRPHSHPHRPRTRPLSASPPPPPLLLVPVPSSPSAVRARGQDATRRLALAAAAELRRCGVRAQVVPVLRQRRRVADQSGLDSRARKANLQGALEVVRGGAGLFAGAGAVVLVDDLMTTGATLAEASRALSEGAGVRVARAAVVAAPANAFGARQQTPGGDGGAVRPARPSGRH